MLHACMLTLAAQTRRKYSWLKATAHWSNWCTLEAFYSKRKYGLMLCLGMCHIIACNLQIIMLIYNDTYICTFCECCVYYVLCCIVGILIISSRGEARSSMDIFEFGHHHYSLTSLLSAGPLPFDICTDIRMQDISLFVTFMFALLSKCIVFPVQ